MGNIIEWINNTGEKIADIILGPFYSLPGFLKFIVVILIAFLSLIGLIRVIKKAFKTVVGVAIVFIIVLIGWIFLSK